MYGIMIADCVRCHKLFGCNPEKVPTIRINGNKEPFCKECVAAIQDLQRKLNLSIWPDPLIGAYEPFNEYENESILEKDTDDDLL